MRGLLRLEEEARAGRAHTFLLVGPDRTEALGALSVRPGGDSAEASWWVVPTVRGSRLEEELDAYARRWLQQHWPFETVTTPDNRPDDPVALAGATIVARVPAIPERTEPPEPDVASAARLWAEYRCTHPAAAEELPPVQSFGDSIAMANELLGLVRRGVKTATASLAEEGAPAAGDHWIVCDGEGAARAVLLTEDVRTGPLDSVDDVFAWAEGEGDRTRESWLDGHRRYFSRVSPGGIGDVVFERFRLVWPEAEAERAAAFARSVGASRPEELDGTPAQD
ncbi:ASCH domain-containing protein [Rathayibacter tanaceti]|nr:ASCH domain-containing protein [Rathayibacter tanaceti]KZX22710.1 ASCH domain protein [Rathayibacter tanaceti]QHC56996.1 ASCH domain-containing protein [Rathayibacter tanaceti]